MMRVAIASASALLVLLAAATNAAADQLMLVCNGGASTTTTPPGPPVPLPGPISILYDNTGLRVLSLGDDASLPVVTDAFSSKSITAHENVDALQMVRTFTLDRARSTFVLRWEAPSTGILWVWQGSCAYPSHSVASP